MAKINFYFALSLYDVRRFCNGLSFEEKELLIINEFFAEPRSENRVQQITEQNGKENPKDLQTDDLQNDIPHANSAISGESTDNYEKNENTPNNSSDENKIGEKTEEKSSTVKKVVKPKILSDEKIFVDITRRPFVVREADKAVEENVVLS